ncbi:MAG: hypothetical protein ACO29A_09705, partial [Ilumatobacteraceae bacterium]
LGSATLDMRNAPDQRVVLEVALLRLVHRQLDNGLDGLAARLERLERDVRRSRGPDRARLQRNGNS